MSTSCPAERRVVVPWGSLFPSLMQGLNGPSLSHSPSTQRQSTGARDGKPKNRSARISDS